jgi:protein SCO1/2
MTRSELPFRLFFASIALLVSTALLATSCQRTSQPNETGTRRFETRGLVRGIAPDRSTLDIEHENIPGFMPSMTMPFPVRDPSAAARLKLGDAISFRLTVTEGDLWMDQIKQIGQKEVSLPPPRSASAVAQTSSTRLREGDELRPFSLTNQDGQPVTPETFRGHPVVLTFIFTRCPVPNFCPRMSNNFAELQKAVRNGRGALAETRLLSITLDPQFDRPDVLRDYAGHLQADDRVWTFATGEPAAIDPLAESFAVYRKTEGGTLSHGLATALVDAHGRIAKIWRGNFWRPEEVIAAIEQNEP